MEHDMNQQMDEIFSNVIDGEVTDEEWSLLVAAAQREPRLWRDLAESQRQHAGMTALVGDAVAIADGVELPEPDGGVRRWQLGAWAGWSMAALITLVWLVGRTPPMNEVETGATPTVYPTAADAFNAYLRQGKVEELVIEELPTRVLLDSRPLPDGGHELLYLRQIVERAIVPDMYEVRGSDDAGQPTLVRYQQPTGGAM